MYLRIYTNQCGDLMYQVINPRMEGTPSYMVEKGDFDVVYLPELLSEHADVKEVVIASTESITYVADDVFYAIKTACNNCDISFRSNLG